MSEIYDDKGIKTIAFYLPQFHPIPENDEHWGKGFTEWTNVKKAEPLFPGHDQPRIPLENNYYNLLDDKIKIQQAKTAKDYGIFGFCYYHYWFKDGKKLLEKPAEQMLQNKKIDIPFCFCWANENWTKKWDGSEQEIIVKQDYGHKKEWEEHFQYLLQFMKDERYITVHGKPLLIIYKPEQIIDIYEMMRFFKKRAVQEGFPGLCLMFQFPSYYADMYYRPDIFDFRIAFEPVYSRYRKAHGAPGTAKKVKLIRTLFGEKPITCYRKKKERELKNTKVIVSKLKHFSYTEAWNQILTNQWTKELLPGAFVDWDNTPRNKNGLVYDGFSVSGFKENFAKLVVRARNENKPMIFINAWNEWAEGAFLEPDEKYGYGKLEAIKEALNE